MKKYSIIIILSIIVTLFVFNFAFSGDWMIYINNKPFNGSFYVSGDLVMVNISDLSTLLNFTYEYNELTDNLKINDISYNGYRAMENEKLMISLKELAGFTGISYSKDNNVRIITIQTFNAQLVPTATPAGKASPTPTPKGPAGNEVQVSDVRKMTDAELMDEGKYAGGSGNYIGVTGTVENTCDLTATDILVNVMVKFPDGKVYETLTEKINKLEPGEAKKLKLYFYNGFAFSPPDKPYLVYDIAWQFESKVDFKLEEPEPEVTPLW